MEENLSQTSIPKQGPVRENAGFCSREIKAIRKIDNAPVYNMEVDDNHNFAVENGLIVHNCMDSMRYFVKTMLIAVKDRR